MTPCSWLLAGHGGKVCDLGGQSLLGPSDDGTVVALRQR